MFFKEPAGRARREETGIDFGNLAKGVHTERTDMEFCSVRATFGIGECLIALVPFSILTSFFDVAGGFTTARRFTRIREAGVEMTRLEGFTPVREFPFGGSLHRTVELNCSRGFMCTLWRG